MGVGEDGAVLEARRPPDGGCTAKSPNKYVLDKAEGTACEPNRVPPCRSQQKELVNPGQTVCAARWSKAQARCCRNGPSDGLSDVCVRPNATSPNATALDSELLFFDEAIAACEAEPS